MSRVSFARKAARKGRGALRQAVPLVGDPHGRAKVDGQLGVPCDPDN